jgi:ABC-2 type transport system permease protein
MKKVLVVALWEYLEKVKSKAFVISLILTPIIMVVMTVLPTLFARQEKDVTTAIGIIDRNGSVAPVLAGRLMERYRLPDGQPRYLVDCVRPAGDIAADRKRMDARVLSGDLEGYLVIGRDILADSVIEYRSSNVGDFRVLQRVEQTLRQVLTEQRLAARGFDPSLLAQITFPLDVKPIKLSESGKEEEGGFEKTFFSAYIFLMMLFFLILTTGQLLVRSVIEEKSNRIVEVLVSSCSPTELMAGKVLGLSALGFTQMGFWALIGVAMSLQTGIALIDPAHAALLVLYFVLGYLFYAAVFIAFGSPVTTEQEAQQVNGYLVMLLVLPIALAFPVVQNPDAGWIRILTFIPFLTSTMMALRIPVHTPPPGEIIASVIVMLVSIYGAMWAAGRIFRIAILATGKRPSLREVLRWIRTGG